MLCPDGHFFFERINKNMSNNIRTNFTFKKNLRDLIIEKIKKLNPGKDINWDHFDFDVDTPVVDRNANSRRDRSVEPKIVMKLKNDPEVKKFYVNENRTIDFTFNKISGREFFTDVLGFKEEYNYDEYKKVWDIIVGFYEVTNGTIDISDADIDPNHKVISIMINSQFFNRNVSNDTFVVNLLEQYIPEEEYSPIALRIDFKRDSVATLDFDDINSGNLEFGEMVNFDINEFIQDN